MQYLSFMQHLLSTSRPPRTQGFFKLGLPGIFLASLLSATPSLAIQSASLSASSRQSEATRLVNSTNTLSQSIEIRMNGFPTRRQRNSGTRTRRQRPTQAAPQTINENLLNRRSNESYEAWYSRIDPMILRMPKQQYQVWKATLPVRDRDAFDAITRRRNYEARERMNQSVRDALWDALTQPSQSGRVTRPNGMSESEWACYINPTCGR